MIMQLVIMGVHEEIATNLINFYHIDPYEVAHYLSLYFQTKLGKFKIC